MKIVQVRVIADGRPERRKLRRRASLNFFACSSHMLPRLGRSCPGTMMNLLPMIWLNSMVACSLSGCRIFERRVRTAGHEAVVIKHLADFLRGAAPITGELHAFVAHLARSAAMVPGKSFLQSSRTEYSSTPTGIFFFAAQRMVRGAAGQAERRARDAKRGELKKLTAGNGFGVFILQMLTRINLETSNNQHQHEQT